MRSLNYNSNGLTRLIDSIVNHWVNSNVTPSDIILWLLGIDEPIKWFDVYFTHPGVQELFKGYPAETVYEAMFKACSYRLDICASLLQYAKEDYVQNRVVHMEEFWSS